MRSNSSGGKRAHQKRLQAAIIPGVRLSLAGGVSMVGGGGLPLLQLPSWLLAVESERFSPGEIEDRLRRAATTVIGRIARGVFLLDVRTVRGWGRGSVGYEQKGPGDESSGPFFGFCIRGQWDVLWESAY